MPCDQALKGGLLDEGRIAWKDEYDARLCHVFARHPNGISCSAGRILDSVGNIRPKGGQNFVSTMPQYKHELVAEWPSGLHDPVKHGSTADRVQDLGQCRPHAGALSGRENDGGDLRLRPH